MAISESKVNELLEELQSLGVSDDCKNRLTQFVEIVRVTRIRKERGLPVGEPTYHMLLAGGDEAQQTAVAKLMARILFALGVIEREEIVETTRSELAGEYIGQAAANTQKVVDSAIGGVLLVHDPDKIFDPKFGDNRCGQEIFETLLPAMEEHRDDLVVFFAGSEKGIDRFLHLDPLLALKLKNIFRL